MTSPPPSAPALRRYRRAQAGQRRSAVPGTRQQTGFPNSASAKHAATPRQRVRSGILPGARGEFARPKSAPPSEPKANSFRVAPTFFRQIDVLVIQHLPQAIDFLRPDTLILKKLQDELLVRILKKAAHQVPDFRARRLLLPHQRRIHMRPSILEMFQIALPLQHTDRSQNRV